MFSTSIFLSQNRQGNVNSFCIVQFSRSFSPPSRRLVYYITSFRVCQVLSQNFFRFFLIFSRFRRNIRGFAYHFRSSLFIISLCFRFVKYFLKYFSDFFDFCISVTFISAPLSRQLLYYTLFLSVCQHIY